MLTNGSGDLDLYVKYGSPLTERMVSAIDADTDFISDGPTANETIVVTPSSTPPLKAGKWYIATFNWNTTTTHFTVTATVETPVAAKKHEMTLSASSEVNAIWAPVLAAPTPSKRVPTAVEWISMPSLP